MRKVVLSAVVLMVLAGCGARPAQHDPNNELVDEVYRAVLKYQIMNGTPEERENPPITDKEVNSMKGYLKGVTDDVYR